VLHLPSGIGSRPLGTRVAGEIETRKSEDQKKRKTKTDSLLLSVPCFDFGAPRSGGFTLYATAQANQNPDMAAALHAAVVQQQGDRVELTLNLTQSQVGTLLAPSLPPRR
jgi:hypothetical protein